MLHLLSALATLLQPVASACDASAETPLFECDEPITLELELPMNTLYRRAESRPATRRAG